MQQLIMRWKNDGKPAAFPDLKDSLQIVPFTELEQAMEKWLDIVQYGLSAKKEDARFYRSMMSEHPHYREDNCYFLVENGRAVATLSVICNPQAKEGYIHMVACRPEARGKGYGTLLNRLALYVLKKEGMKTAYLTTDDWRIPAIKSYLRAGFEPDLSTEDFKARWAALRQQIGVR